MQSSGRESRSTLACDHDLHLDHLRVSGAMPPSGAAASVTPASGKLVLNQERKYPDQTAGAMGCIPIGTYIFDSSLEGIALNPPLPPPPPPPKKKLQSINPPTKSPSRFTWGRGGDYRVHHSEYIEFRAPKNPKL